MARIKSEIERISVIKDSFTNTLAEFERYGILLNRLKTYISKIDSSSYPLSQEHALIKTKATAVYTIFQQEYPLCETLDAQAITTRCHQLEVTIDLLTAKPGQVRAEALASYLTTANQLYGDPVQKKRDLILSIAMLALGVALVGVAVTVAICLAMELWPFIPVATHWCIIHPILCHNGLEVPIGIEMLGIFGSILSGLGGLLCSTIGVSTICDSAKRLKNANTMTGLHGAFFNSNKEIITLCLPTENDPVLKNESLYPVL